MTAAEALLILLLLGILLFVVYYLLKGSTGRITFARPVESRIDEYLDQRFEDLIAEWSLTTRPKLRKFERTKTPVLQEDESRMAALKSFQNDMKVTLDTLEERLDALETEMAAPKRGRKKS